MHAPAEAVATRLILVRHGNPRVLPDTPAAGWPLSDDGRERSSRLARQVGPVSAQTVYSSAEPKAVDTARAVGAVLGLPVTVAEGLHEHDRRETPLLEPHEFEAALRRFFASPTECVFGRESAAAASARFARAVNTLIATAGGEDVIIVTHGTVMALFLAPSARLDPFSLWRTLSMPCAAIVRLPALKLDRIVALE